MIKIMIRRLAAFLLFALAVAVFAPVPAMADPDGWDCTGCTGGGRTDDGGGD